MSWSGLRWVDLHMTHISRTTTTSAHCQQDKNRLKPMALHGSLFELSGVSQQLVNSQWFCCNNHWVVLSEWSSEWSSEWEGTWVGSRWFSLVVWHGASQEQLTHPQAMFILWPLSPGQLTSLFSFAFHLSPFFLHLFFPPRCCLKVWEWACVISVSGCFQIDNN